MASSQPPRLVLITGANKGIGFSAAEQFASQGFKVLLAARNSALGQEAVTKINATSPKSPAVFVPLEVGNDSSVDAAFALVSAQFGKLDVLVNNAAIFQDTVPTSQISQEVLKETFNVNFFGQVYLTQRFLPLLKLSDTPRIVFLSSGLGSLALHSDPAWDFYKVKVLAYNSSKTALNAFAVHLAAELKDTPFKINLVNPGSVLTDMNKNGTRTPAQAGAVIVKYATLPADGPTGGFFEEEGVIPW